MGTCLWSSKYIPEINEWTYARNSFWLQTALSVAEIRNNSRLELPHILINLALNKVIQLMSWGIPIYLNAWMISISHKHECCLHPVTCGDFDIATGSRDGASLVPPIATNVTRVRFPGPASYVGWVCGWFSSLLREFFQRVLRFYSLHKKKRKNTSKFQFDRESEGQQEQIMWLKSNIRWQFSETTSYVPIVWLYNLYMLHISIVDTFLLLFLICK